MTVEVAGELVSGRNAMRGVAMEPARETPTRRLTPGDDPRGGALLVVASTTDAFDIPGAGHDLSGPDQFRLCLEADLPETPPFDQVWTVLVCEAGESVGWVDITPARATAEPVPAGGYALDSHLRDVARRAAAWASQLGIHADLLADITAAARLHDEGKRAAPIQQEYSLVVDETGLLIQRQGEASGAALAKSARPAARMRRSARRRPVARPTSAVPASGR